MKGRWLAAGRGLVAIVMWELLTGMIPWKGMDIVQIIQQAADNDIIALHRNNSTLNILLNKTNKRSDPNGRARSSSGSHSRRPFMMLVIFYCDDTIFRTNFDARREGHQTVGRCM